MAIAKVKKLEIIGLQEEREQLLGLLQKLGAVELLNVDSTQLDFAAQKITPETDLAEIERNITFLASFKKQNPLEGIFGVKPQIYPEQLKEVMTHFDYVGFLKELSQLRNHLNDLMQHKDKLNQEFQTLLPWTNLSISLDEIQPTHRCAVLLGVLYRRDYINLLKDLEKNNLRFFLEPINQDKAHTYLVIIYLKEEFVSLEQILKNYHFNPVILPRYKSTVSQRLYEINQEVSNIDKRRGQIKSKIAQLSLEQFKLMVVYDSLYNIKKRQEADKILKKQKFTFILSGWVKQKDLEFLDRQIKDEFKDIAIFISEPGSDEEVPVALENKKIFQPFEFITGIYGMPKYNEIDPTPYLAPFFFLYFGFCVSDFGYGLILALVSFFVLKRFKMGSQGTKFWRLFLFCSISTMLIGALTGSWFGNLFDLLAQSNQIFLPLKKFKDAIVILDPLKEPTKLLGIALSLGIIQVWFGNVLAALGNIKNRRYLDIILDQVPMLTLLFGLTGLGLIFLKLLENTHISLFKYATLLAAIALILTQGRSEKGLGSKLFYGIYNLYNALSGYLSDILSYSRLWALGLVTGVMAVTINLIAVQFSQILTSMIPFIDKIMVIKIIISASIIVAIFVFGHVVSFLINLIGAFVHPVRLQFVEFFSKFFKSGGSSFKSFKVETKYINIS